MKLIFAFASALALVPASAGAVVVNINLSGASTGTVINTPEASFAQRFAGQTVSGTSLTGSPTNPLTVSAAGTIDVAFFNPGVSPGSNSLLSQPGNLAPLAVRLAQSANSFVFTMGSSNAGSTVDVKFYNLIGAQVASTQIVMGSGYNIYNLNGFGTFRGITFSNNNDPAGVRFQNMSYNTVTEGAIPEPATWALMIAGFGFVGASLRRTRVRIAYS